MTVKYTRKNVNIDQEILEFISKSEKCKFTDITTNKRLLDRRSKSTLEKRITILRESEILKKKEGIYRVNNYIRDYSKDYKQQIKEGEKKETDHKKLLEISYFKEKELRDRITNSETTNVMKDFGELTNEIFISNEDNLFLANVFYSFLREEIIFNPGLWTKLIKPAHFNFKFKIVCNWEKDQQIFILINELKEIYKKIGFIPHNINSPFHRKEEAKLNNTNDEIYYKNNVYEETIRLLTEEKTKEREKSIIEFRDDLKLDFRQIINNSQKVIKNIDDPSISKATNMLDTLEDIIQDSDNNELSTRKEIENTSQKFKNLFGDLKKIIGEID